MHRHGQSRGGPRSLGGRGQDQDERDQVHGGPVQSHGGRRQVRGRGHIVIAEVCQVQKVVDLPAVSVVVEAVEVDVDGVMVDVDKVVVACTQRQSEGSGDDSDWSNTASDVEYCLSAERWVHRSLWVSQHIRSLRSSNPNSWTTL